MPEVWAAVVGAIVLLIAYGVVSSRKRTARLRKAREKILPFVAETVRTGQRYNLYLSDGRKFLEAELVGTSDPESGQSPFGGYEGMLVLKQPSGKKAFVRPSSVRVVEEA